MIQYNIKYIYIFNIIYLIYNILYIYYIYICIFMRTCARRGSKIVCDRIRSRFVYDPAGANQCGKKVEVCSRVLDGYAMIYTLCVFFFWGGGPFHNVLHIHYGTRILYLILWPYHSDYTVYDGENTSRSIWLWNHV